MKTFLYATAGLLVLAGTAHAQVSVLDMSGLVQAVKNYGVDLQTQLIETKQLIESELSWAVQAQQYATQTQQYVTEATQLAGFIHDPSLGAVMGLMNQAGLGSAMPVSPYAVMGVVSGVHYGGGGIPQIQGVLGSLSGLSGTAYDTNHVYTPTDGTWDSGQVIANANSIAGTQGTALAAYGDLTNHAAAFAAMRDHLNAATTPKDVQDAQAEIALEQTWTANEQAKLAATQIAFQAQQASMAQQGDEKITQSLSGPGGQIEQARAAGIIP